MSNTSKFCTGNWHCNKTNTPCLTEGQSTTFTACGKKFFKANSCKHAHNESKSRTPKKIFHCEKTNNSCLKEGEAFTACGQKFFKSKSCEHSLKTKHPEMTTSLPSGLKTVKTTKQLQLQ